MSRQRCSLTLQTFILCDAWCAFFSWVYQASHISDAFQPLFTNLKEVVPWVIHIVVPVKVIGVFGAMVDGWNVSLVGLVVSTATCGKSHVAIVTQPLWSRLVEVPAPILTTAQRVVTRSSPSLAHRTVVAIPSGTSSAGPMFRITASIAKASDETVLPLLGARVLVAIAERSFGHHRASTSKRVQTALGASANKKQLSGRKSLVLVWKALGTVVRQ